MEFEGNHFEVRLTPDETVQFRFWKIGETAPDHRRESINLAHFETVVKKREAAKVLRRLGIQLLRKTLDRSFDPEQITVSLEPVEEGKNFVVVRVGDRLKGAWVLASETMAELAPILTMGLNLKHIDAVSTDSITILNRQIAFTDVSSLEQAIREAMVTSVIQEAPGIKGPKKLSLKTSETISSAEFAELKQENRELREILLELASALQQGGFTIGKELFDRIRGQKPPTESDNDAERSEVREDGVVRRQIPFSLSQSGVLDIELNVAAAGKVDSLFNSPEETDSEIAGLMKQAIREHIEHEQSENAIDLANMNPLIKTFGTLHYQSGEYEKYLIWALEHAYDPDIDFDIQDRMRLFYYVLKLDGILVNENVGLDEGLYLLVRFVAKEYELEKRLTDESDKTSDRSKLLEIQKKFIQSLYSVSLSSL